MRIRLSLPLPGPFRLTSGGSSSTGGMGLLVVAGLLYLGAWFAWPVPMVIAHAVVLGLIAVVLAVKHSTEKEE